MSSIFDTQNETVHEDTSETEEKQVYAVNADEEIVVRDTNADYNILPPPPPAGMYPVKFRLDDKKETPIEIKGGKNGSYCVVHLVASVIANGQDYDGQELYEHPTSYYDRKRGTTLIHHIMNCLGDPLPANSTPNKIKAHVERVLNSNPVGNVEIQWQAKELDKNNKRADKGGWVTLASRESQFPMINGIRSNFVKSERDGSPVAAQAFILAYNK